MRNETISPLERGFTLIGVVVLVGVLLVLVMAATPLAMRELTRQRQATTQLSLEAAFKGMFGALGGRRGGNLRDDCSYVPRAGVDIKVLVSPVGQLDGNGDAVPLAYAYNNATFRYEGWNGPYWQGSTDSGLDPVDAWGRPISLKEFPDYVSSTSGFPYTSGWQFLSLGANGQLDTASASTAPAGDDQVYPSVPYVIPLPAGPPICAGPTIHFNRLASGPAEHTTITITWTTGAGGSQSFTTVFNNGHPDGQPIPGFTNIPSGTLIISFVSDRRVIPSQTVTLEAGACVVTPDPINF